jgi:ABC-type Fe3+ transport system permease subunit
MSTEAISSTVAALTVAVTAAIRMLSKRDPDFGPGFIQLLTTLSTALPTHHECSQEVLMALKVAAGQR